MKCKIAEEKFWFFWKSKVRYILIYIISNACKWVYMLLNVINYKQNDIYTHVVIHKYVLFTYNGTHTSCTHVHTYRHTYRYIHWYVTGVGLTWLPQTLIFTDCGNVFSNKNCLCILLPWPILLVNNVLINIPKLPPNIYLCWLINHLLS